MRDVSLVKLSFVLGFRFLGAVLGLGTMPDFIIIGAQRSGTTSLYNYLICHPGIVPAITKEAHYFDKRFHLGETCYQSVFPMKAIVNRWCAKESALRGEATPYYIFHPHAPRRIAQTLPNVRLIALLRNPVDRAYSHFLHAIRMGWEHLTFEEAIGRDETVQEEEMKMLQDESYRSLKHQHFSYLSRGVYHRQLRRYLEFFNRNQLRVIQSEDFFVNTSAVLQRTLSFLGIYDTGRGSAIFEQHQSLGAYPAMNPETREHLVDYFRPHNEELSNLLGREFHWNN